MSPSLNKHFDAEEAWRLHANSIIFVFQDKAGRTSVSGCNREAGGGIQEIGIRGRAAGPSLQAA
jgi:hypothetical protein